MHIYLDTSGYYHLRILVAFCNSKLTDLVHYKRLRVMSKLKNICSAAKKVQIKQWLVKPCLEAKHLRKNKERMGRGRRLSARQDILLYSPTMNGALQPATASLRWLFPAHLLCSGKCVRFHTSSPTGHTQEPCVVDSICPSSHMGRALVRSLHHFTSQCLIQLILKSVRMC